MGVFAGPDVSESGLVLAVDGANYKSFKGEVTTNLIPDPILGQQVVGSGGSGYSVSTDNTIINPFGNNGATKIVVNSSGSGYTRQGGTVNLTAGVTYTFSCFFKNGNVNLSNITNSTLGSTFGIVIQSFSPTYDALEGYFNLVSTTSYPNDWVRKSFTFTPNYTQTYYCSFSTTPSTETAGTYYLYGFQLEQKSYSSSFVAGTRGSTVATGGGWADLIGNGNHGELLNGVREDSANGGSLVFDGTNDFISITKTSQFDFGTSNFAIETFCNLTSKSSSFPCIFSNYSSYGSGAIYFGYDHDSVLSKYSIHVNGTGYLSSSSNVTYNVWTHLTLVRSSGVLYFYINGVLDGTPLNMSSSLNGNGSLITIGKANDGSSAFTHGKIANFKIYNRALTESEIQQNFNASRARFGI